MFANVRWQPVYMYNTITSWYATMYHETSVILTHESLELRGHYHQISELRQRYHSHQEQYWNKKKSMFNSGWNHCKCFTRTQFLHWLKPEHHWKKKKILLVFRNEPLIVTWWPPRTKVAACQSLSVITKKEQLQVKISSSWPTRGGGYPSLFIALAEKESYELTNTDSLPRYTQSTQSLTSDKGS